MLHSCASELQHISSIVDNHAALQRMLQPHCKYRLKTCSTSLYGLSYMLIIIIMVIRLKLINASYNLNTGQTRVMPMKTLIISFHAGHIITLGLSYDQNT